MTNDKIHIPVLQKEVLKYLDPKPNENFVDCTIGGGGHSLAILEKIMPDGKVLGIDWTPELIEGLKIKNNLILVCDNFAHLFEIIEKHNFKPVAGVLLDLGMSSWHLEQSGRGFSFLKDDPLIMRYAHDKSQKSKFPEGPGAQRVERSVYGINPGAIPSGCYGVSPGAISSRCYGAGRTQNLTAEEIVNNWQKPEIEGLLKEYGEERFAGRIAGKIVEARKLKPIKTTFQLAEIIKEAVPKFYERGRIHPATRTFQALRIAVNDELNNLKTVLAAAAEILKPGGRLAIISFHSLEDRIVKNFLRDKQREGLLRILTKKPIAPSLEEIKINPRSRSAKLRAAIKLESIII